MIYFNSLRLPLAILLTVPLGFVGVMVGLLVTGNTFNTLSFLGIVALTGIVVNDGIIMVNCIRQRRRDEPERPWREVVVAAAQTRLRPVFVTTVTTAGGLVPLAGGWGGGGEFWQPLAYAIIFGICAATLLTLIVLPVLIEHIYPERD